MNLGERRHRVRRQLGGVLGADQRDAQDGGGGLGVVALGDQAQAGQQAEQAAPGLLLEAAGAREIGVFQAAAFDQGRDDAVVGVGLDAGPSGLCWVVSDDRVHASSARTSGRAFRDRGRDCSRGIVVRRAPKRADRRCGMGGGRRGEWACCDCTHGKL
jgi:hypothetical protein